MNARLEQLLLMLQDDPTDSFLRYAAAVEYAAMGNNEEAIQRITALLADQPDYLGAYYKLGQLHEQRGDAVSALEVYRKGAEVARLQNNTKTLGELNTAMMLLED